MTPMETCTICGTTEHVTFSMWCYTVCKDCDTKTIKSEENNDS